MYMYSVLIGFWCEFLYFISGIDSRYNDGMTELMNYLLFGFFELRKTELEKYIWKSNK